MTEPASDDSELHDSEVRERMSEALADGFIRAKADCGVRDDFGIFDSVANEDVRKAIISFILPANAVAADKRIVSFHDRLAAFQNHEMCVAPGSDYEEFFGHSPPEWYDTDGHVIWDRVR